MGGKRRAMQWGQWSNLDKDKTIMEIKSGLTNSTKDHKSNKSMASGGTPKREQVPPGRRE
jgi:hypothetical protein